jgi:hypothetical protein
MTATLTPADRKAKVGRCVFGTVLASLFLLFAVQLRSPLRLNPDAIAILKLTEELTDAKPYLQDGMRPVFPVGMPFIYSLMERAGIANPIGFGSLNLACIGLAACCPWIICTALGPRKAAPIIMLVSFSNFVLVKHEVIPLTDIPFMAASLACLALLESLPSQRDRKWLMYVTLSLVALAAAMLIRRVGIALVPALAYAVWPNKAQRASIKSFLATRQIRLIATAGVCVVATGALALALRKALYLRDWKFGGSPFAAARLQVEIRLIDFGLLFCNVPSSGRGALLKVILFAVMILGILIAIGLWRIRRNPHPTHVYLLTYLAIMAPPSFRARKSGHSTVANPAPSLAGPRLPSTPAPPATSASHNR